jgi:hypothetical protein
MSHNYATREGSSPDNTTAFTKTKGIPDLVEFSAHRARIDVGSLNRVLSCPYLETFVVQDARLISIHAKHRSGGCSEHLIQRQMQELVQNAQLLCPRQKTIALIGLITRRFADAEITGRGSQGN